MNPYSYASNPVFDLKLSKRTRNYDVFRVEATFDGPKGAPQKYAAEIGEYYKPADKNKNPLIILAHGIGDRGDGLSRMIAKDLVKKGIACFVAIQLFHPRRIAPNLKPRFPNIEPDEWFDLYGSCVVEIRQIVDWAETNADLIRGQIAIMGISLGGIISAITMGVDDRIKAGIFAVAGGNFESRAWLKRVGNKCTEEECLKITANYEQFLKAAYDRGFENVEPLKKSYLYDPVTFAYRLKQRDLFMINAMWDEMFPRQSTLDFWKACNEPQILWLPGTHATVWLLYPIMRREITRFLRSEFSKT